MDPRWGAQPYGAAGIWDSPAPFSSLLLPSPLAITQEACSFGLPQHLPLVGGCPRVGWGMGPVIYRGDMCFT